MVGVVTDGGAAIAPELLKAAGILVVPMQLEAEAERCPGWCGPAEDIMDAIGKGDSPSFHTAAPSPGAFVEAIERADGGDGVAVLTVSRAMSSSYDAALLAASMCRAQVEVIDTGTGAGAQGLVVLAAARQAAAGASLDGVLRRARVAADRVRLVAQVGDLRPLVRSGRLPESLARIGNAVGLRPVFQFRRGSIRVLRPALSEEAATDALIAAWRGSIEVAHHLHVTATYGRDAELAKSVLKAVSWEFAPATAYVSQFTPVMLAHTGTDILGLAWWWEPVDTFLTDPGWPGRSRGG